MKQLDINCLATINFEINWNSADAAHKEIYLARKANLWRDIFPPGMKEAILGLEAGRKLEIDYPPGQAVPKRSSRNIIKTSRKEFLKRSFKGRPILPRPGRFYPRSMLGPLHFFPQNMLPCRIISVDDQKISADLAHPLADYNLKISAVLENFALNECETGGRLTHWMEEILSTGPGMQARLCSQPTSFISPGAFDRNDKSDDTLFYKNPRFTDHIDAQARQFLCRLYAEHLKPGMKILDLMASVNSHLPTDMEVHTTGLGLNKQEMEANPLLDSSLVHDLNQTPDIPFEDSSFDAVLCSLSVEYLVNPCHLAREAARILRPAGLFMVSFSNRWFPPKVTKIWQELHEFERMGFVMDTMLKTGNFADFATVSIRNWWRPEDDPHIDKTWISDPVYLVKARKI